MHTPTRRRFVQCALSAPVIALSPVGAIAAPQVYVMDAARSLVGFSITALGDTYSGTMPVASADMSLDFSNVANSRVAVTLRPADAQMGFAFATQALKSAEVLDTANHPLISFASTTIRAGATPSQAIVTGRVTARGITHPVTLNARLSQEATTQGQANPELSLLLTGGLDRHAFGASGYRSIVDPTVDLRIVAKIKRSG